MKNLIESLEGRRLYSVSIVHGTLTVDGTNAADVITVGRKGGATIVTVDGNRHTITRSYSRVVVNALGGNDNISIATNMKKPVIVYGGAGDDTITGLAEMHGGAGNDILTGANVGQGNMYGDAGNDTLIGNGNCIMDGGTGDDTIRHGWGYANLIGGTGSDTITGNNYGDTLDYSHRTSAVHVDFSTGIVTFDGTTDIDTIHGIRKAIGTPYADSFIGIGPGYPTDDEPFFVHGNGGSDTFSDFSIYDSTGE